MSKLLERLVSKQLVTYLRDSGLLPKLQSAFRAYHSTETPVVAPGGGRHSTCTGYRQHRTSDAAGSFCSV